MTTIQTIKIPKVTYVVGDWKRGTPKTMRPLYGPENENGGRPLAGYVHVDHVEAVSTRLDFADANMPEDADLDRQDGNDL